MARRARGRSAACAAVDRLLRGRVTAVQSPANHAQAQTNLAICLVHEGHPEEGIRLATGALAITRGGVEPNLQQADEFLTALTLRHRDLPATRDFADHLHALRTNTLN